MERELAQRYLPHYPGLALKSTLMNVSWFSSLLQIQLLGLLCSVWLLAALCCQNKIRLSHAAFKPRPEKAIG